MARSWRRPAVYLKEVKRLKLSTLEAVRVTTVMTRYAEDRAMRGDHSYLRDGVEELKVSADNRRSASISAG